MRLGATLRPDDGCTFRVWAPLRKTVEVNIILPDPQFDIEGGTPSIAPTHIPMKRDSLGYWTVTVPQVRHGTRYTYRLDGHEDRPDPASRWQPDGVHGPSAVFGSEFSWNDESWRNPPLSAYRIYEIHIGTFTPEGTFAAAISRLKNLRELGVTAVELMPVAAFPGKRNWGYDGVFPFAVHEVYGGAEGLKAFVEACHNFGLAVILDVVYNHLGPEGNYLSCFGPYFTDRYKTPWGPALNFDGPWSDGVREFFFQNAQQWISDFHVDALRLDAVHAIFDHGARHFLGELADRVAGQTRLPARPAYVIAESDLNDSRLLTLRQGGGYALHAQWSDDFHHAFHALMTGETGGYYEDFGEPQHLVKAWTDTFVYDGIFSPHRQRRHGNPARQLAPERFVHFTQNHDQIGNRQNGERTATLLPLPALRLEAVLLVLSPGLPLFFMGQEYGEPAPFQFFADHGDQDLRQAVRSGRQREFSAFGWSTEPPDPFLPETFARCVLHWDLSDVSPRRELRDLYRFLLRLRDSHPVFSGPDSNGESSPDGLTPTGTSPDTPALAPSRVGLKAGRLGSGASCWFLRETPRAALLILANLGPQPATGVIPDLGSARNTSLSDATGKGSARNTSLSDATGKGSARNTSLSDATGKGSEWRLLLDAADELWGGSGTHAPAKPPPDRLIEIPPWGCWVYELGGEAPL